MTNAPVPRYSRKMLLNRSVQVVVGLRAGERKVVEVVPTDGLGCFCIGGVDCKNLLRAFRWKSWTFFTFCGRSEMREHLCEERERPAPTSAVLRQRHDQVDCEAQECRRRARRG